MALEDIGPKDFAKKKSEVKKRNIPDVEQLEELYDAIPFPEHSVAWLGEVGRIREEYYSQFLNDAPLMPFTFFDDEH